jgi:2-polyprenyl-3-methyl-5-hydroxy-6-metoxy-1,4-benzoquinol methylase
MMGVHKCRLQRKASEGIKYQQNNNVKEKDVLMAFLSDLSARRKIDFFLKPIPKDKQILEVGCGNGWVGDYLRRNGWTGYVGLDLRPPADIVGDIRNWRQLGIQEGSFDVIIAFEVIEHGDFFQEFYEILKPGGMLFLTSPLPHMDWFMRSLEFLKLNQKRTSSHTHLTYFQKIPYFHPRMIKVVGGLAQWGILTKPVSEDP